MTDDKTQSRARQQIREEEERLPRECERLDLGFNRAPSPAPSFNFSRETSPGRKVGSGRIINRCYPDISGFHLGQSDIQLLPDRPQTFDLKPSAPCDSNAARWPDSNPESFAALHHGPRCDIDGQCFVKVGGSRKVGHC